MKNVKMKTCKYRGKRKTMMKQKKKLFVGHE